MSTMSSARQLRMPHPPLLLRVIRVSVAFWLLLRVAYVLVILVSVLYFEVLSSGEGVEAALQPVWPSRVLLVALTIFLVWLHRRAGHEHLLQADLGVRPVWFPAASLMAAGAADLTVQALVRSL